MNNRELNLPKHPNILFLIIIFDLFALVAVYGLYSSNWVGEAGIPVKITSQEAQNIPISDNHIIVKILPEPADHYIIGSNAVQIIEFADHLEQAVTDYKIDQVLLITDKNASVEREREIIKIVRDLRLSCILVADNKTDTNSE